MVDNSHTAWAGGLDSTSAPARAVEGLGPEQQEAYDLVQSGKNLFITGAGGCGKSYLIRRLITEGTIVAAPTGLAALNVGGTTCHRAFKLPVGLSSNLKPLNADQAAVLRAAERVIISEVGALRADYLDMIDGRLKSARKSKAPFGGVQVVVEGDFYQIEPVVGNAEAEVFKELYTSPFSFDARSWNFDSFELKEPQRHKNLEHVALLARLRVGNREALDELMRLSRPYKLSPDVLHLAYTNADADKINHYWLRENQNPRRIYHANTEGEITDSQLSSLPVDVSIPLKVGARVLLRTNQHGLYVNGDRGVVESLHPGSVVVRLLNGNHVCVAPFRWVFYQYGMENGTITKKQVGAITQMPISLGWAISVHKSQGMTLDSAAVYTGRGAFAHGQFYVACSRVKDLNQLSFVRPQHINRDRELIIRPEVAAFYEKRVGGR